MLEETTSQLRSDCNVRDVRRSNAVLDAYCCKQMMDLPAVGRHHLSIVLLFKVGSAFSTDLYSYEIVETMAPRLVELNYRTLASVQWTSNMDFLVQPGQLGNGDCSAPWSRAYQWIANERPSLLAGGPGRRRGHLNETPSRIRKKHIASLFERG
jgi:hypothetical protein